MVAKIRDIIIIDIIITIRKQLLIDIIKINLQAYTINYKHKKII